MQSVIAFACLLAVASAGYLHAPVVGPAVAYGAYEDGSYRGEGLYEGAYKGEGLIESQGYVAPVVAAHAYAAPAYALASQARLVDPVAVAAGAPLPTGDTVEVAAAKAAHFAAHAAAKSQVYAAPVVAPVVAARTYAAPIAHAYAAPAVALASEARQVDPVAIAAGAPLPTGDTVEVAAAKASHFQAHAAAKGLAYGAPVVAARTYASHAYAAPVAHAYAAPVAHAYGAHLGLASEARLVDPVAIAAGAPLPTGDTYEVAAAKAVHYAAHHEAKKGHFLAKGHFIAKRSPVYAPLAYTAPIRSYGYSTIAAPLAYSAYNTYGYGRFGYYL